MSDSFLFYKELLGIYRSGPNKTENKGLICTMLKRRFLEKPDDYELKVLMETQFMRDVKCDYMFFFTPDNVGCDLRELVFNIAKEEDKTSILQSINSIEKPVSIPHILTDIDDTIYPNVHGIIETAGSDRSWDKKQPYPGLKKFYELFYKNLKQENTRYTTVLSGTPVFLKQHRLESAIIQNTIGPNFGFIQGFDNKRTAFRALLKGMWEQPFYKMAISTDSIANVKYEKYQQYKQLFPEYKILFIGDNGQGDLQAGYKMINSEPTCQVFIHNLLRADGFIFTDEEVLEKKRSTDNRLFFFKNYLELGYQFYKLGYISLPDYGELRTAIAIDLRSGLQPTQNNHYFHYVCPITEFPPEVCFPSIKRGGTHKRRKPRCITRKNRPKL